MTAPTLTREQASPKLWSYVWKLLRLRWVIFTSEFRRAKFRRKFGMIALGVLVVGGMAFAFALSWMLLKFLQSPTLVEQLGAPGNFLDSIPVLVFSAAALTILVTSFGVLLQALYLAGDMDFLLSAPIPIRAIFVSKLIQAILPNLGLVMLFGLPVLFGLGASAGYSLLYYPLVVILLALLAFAIAGLASLLVMLVVKIFPARRVAEMLGFLVAIISIICSQSGNLVRFVNVSQSQAAQAFSMASRFNTPWSPLTWVARGLVDIGEQRWLSGGALIVLTILITASIFAISLATAERLYYSGWASVQVSTRRKRNGRAARRGPARTIPMAGITTRFIPAAVSGIVAKDFLMLRRDLRNMSQVVTPLILGILYAFMLISRGGRAPAGQGEAPEAFMDALQNLMVYANVGISLFVGWSLLSRLATMGFSIEGKQYWMLKVAPVSANKLLAAKYLVAYLPTVVLGFVFLVVISILQKTSLGTALFSLLVLVLTLAGLAALSLTFGVLGANFDWTDPRRISQGSAGCFGALASMVFLIFSLGFFFGPALLIQSLNGSVALGQWIGLFLGSVFSLAAGFVPLWLVRQRVPRLNEA
jgi:ABC-2 type transport system permease protein